MNERTLFCALWIKSKLGLDATPRDNNVSTPVGVYLCDVEDDILRLYGPGLDDHFAISDLEKFSGLINYLIDHGDSIVLLPEEYRQKRISDISRDYGVTPEFIKTAIAHARQMSEKYND